MRLCSSTWVFRLGKTAVSLSALTPDHLPALVIAPKRVAENVWSTEAALWRPDLTVSVVAGTPAQRREARAVEADIYVIGRDNIGDFLNTDGQGHIKGVTADVARYRTVILDELSGFKSRSSKRWKAALWLTRDTPHVWGLTGTPTPNGLLDLWAQVCLLDHGERLGRGARIGTGYTKFQERYFFPGNRMPNGVITEWRLRPGADDAIHRAIEDICLSMTTDGRIDLPPVTENAVSVPLPASVMKDYRTFKRDLVLSLDVLGDGEIFTASNAAVLTSKLSQMSAGGLYEDDADLKGGTYRVLHSEKVKAVREIVDGTGSPVLVFYHFKFELDALRKEFPEARLATEAGVVADWNAGRVPVLLAHPASAGHGLNLQHGGHTVVWTTLPWSMELWQQANKRLARQGQKNHVVIHLLEAPGTVDGTIRHRLQDKVSVQDALMTYLESPI